MAGVDQPDRAGDRAHRQGLGQHLVGPEADAAQELAVGDAGGGEEHVVAADQVVAYPLGPTTDHLAGLVLAPLNLAWLLQAWSLLAAVAVLTQGGHTWAAVVPVLLWLVAVTVGAVVSTTEVLKTTSTQ